MARSRRNFVPNEVSLLNIHDDAGKLREFCAAKRLAKAQVHPERCTPEDHRKWNTAVNRLVRLTTMPRKMIVKELVEDYHRVEQSLQ